MSSSQTGSSRTGSIRVSRQGGEGTELGPFTPEQSLAAPIPVIECEAVDIFYGDFKAVSNVSLSYGRHEITAMIGPSGCGKSTVLRSLNRMNDLVPGLGSAE
jgi:phosphate transport system ATP-binding protein